MSYNFKHFVPHLVFGLKFAFYAVFLMANCVDPGQTALEGAVWSGSALPYAISSETFDYKI